MLLIWYPKDFFSKFLVGPFWKNFLSRYIIFSDGEKSSDSIGLVAFVWRFIGELETQHEWTSDPATMQISYEQSYSDELHVYHHSRRVILQVARYPRRLFTWVVISEGMHDDSCLNFEQTWSLKSILKFKVKGNYVFHLINVVHVREIRRLSSRATSALLLRFTQLSLCKRFISIRSKSPLKW